MTYQERSRYSSQEPFLASIENNVSIRNTVNNDILARLITIGVLITSTMPKSDSRIQELDRGHRSHTLEILQNNQSIKDRVTSYQTIIGEFVKTQQLKPPLIEFVRQTFQPVFTGKEDLATDIQTYGPGLIIATHNTRTADTDLADLTNLGQQSMQNVNLSLGARILNRIGMSLALEGTDISTAELVGKSTDSELYNQTMINLGNTPFSNVGSRGTDDLTEQMRAISERGQTPIIYPEGGFRALAVWRTGALVSAVKAGIHTLYLVPHSPLISLLAPEMTFDYVRKLDIPSDVIDAVQNGKKEPVKSFSDKIQRFMAKSIQGLPYPTVYKQFTSQFIEV